MLVEVSVAGAFFGGTLAIFSPCSALLLPAFFAYAFKSRKEMAWRTLVFFAGLVTLLIPLGVGASFAGKLLLDYRSTTIVAVGVLLIGFGVLEFFGIGFSILPQRFFNRRIDDSWGSAYAVGLVYAFAGFCSGPLLGAVLTMAAGAETPFQGGLLLFAYALGMALPLFVLAALWDRYDLGSKSWLRGRPWHIGPYKVHSTNVVSALLFAGLGIIFIFSGGTVAFEGLFSRLGIIEVSMNLQRRMTEAPPWAINAVALSVVALIAVILYTNVRRRNVIDGTRDDDDNHRHDQI